jgi:hypothetical protein
VRSLRLVLEDGLLSYQIRIRQRHNLVTEGRRNLFECLVASLSAISTARAIQYHSAYLREVEVRNDQEERRASNEDVVVILSDIRECRRPRFSDADILQKKLAGTRRYEERGKGLRQPLSLRTS